MTVLNASQLHKSFGRDKKRVEAVNGVSLKINEGEILAFLGRNGAGKTTTIKMIAGLLIPDSGEVSINGRNPMRDRSVYKELGKVLEGSRNLYLQLTARENLEYFGVLLGLSLSEARDRATELLKFFELEHKASARVRELSRGMQQKLSVAVSLAHRPRLLLLDEPTNGLDVESSETIKALLKQFAKEGLAVLLTTHQLDVAQAVSDRVAVISDGKIIAEESTAKLIRQFSGEALSVRVQGILESALVLKLKALPAVAEVTSGDSSATVVCRDASALYQVLDLLRPAPIEAIERNRLDLTEVFMRIVQRGEGGQSPC